MTRATKAFADIRTGQCGKGSKNQGPETSDKQAMNWAIAPKTEADTPG